MKAITALIALSTLATTTHADDKTDQLLRDLGSQMNQAWYQDDETNAWLLADTASNAFKPAPCSDTLMKLRNGGAPANLTIELRDDSRDLKKGVHALPAVRRACDAIEYAGKIKEVERWLTMAAESDSINNRAAFANCLESYAEATAAGVKPTERVPQRRVRIGQDLVMWSGTLEELKIKYCDAGMEKIKAELGKREAPYRKVLKADKLALALGFNATALYVLPGGDKSMNPKKLAASRVWFDSTSAPSNEAQSCSDGRRRVLVRKYVFDARHKLVKTTQKESCGEPVWR
ncbi:MAG TPA: hypothetical protein VK427_00965 [Kofleriaceae bacterium]|nr:hypothetical protein [Kofleriaceae bacterium]